MTALFHTLILSLKSRDGRGAQERRGNGEPVAASALKKKEVGWMKSLGPMKAFMLSALAGGGIVAGALLFGGGIVSAADPTPTPAPGQEQTTPVNPQTPQSGTQHDSANCPNMGNDSTTPGANSSGPSGGGVGFRSMRGYGPRA
jgi:hypothetical protein